MCGGLRKHNCEGKRRRNGVGGVCACHYLAFTLASRVKVCLRYEIYNLRRRAAGRSAPQPETNRAYQHNVSRRSLARHRHHNHQI